MKDFGCGWVGTAKRKYKMLFDMNRAFSFFLYLVSLISNHMHLLQLSTAAKDSKD